MSERRLHAFLAGRGPDARGRRLADVLALDDAGIEDTHDFVQWLFPLGTASRAVPGSPVLGADEAAAIRADPIARDGVARGLARMARFYAGTSGWLAAHDHNHLRIARILTAARDLLGPVEARAFHDAVAARDDAAGNPINPGSRAFWRRALDDR